MVLFEGTSTWKCRVCGCTDDHACPGGCHWVEKDLCSRCGSLKQRIHEVANRDMSDVERMMGGAIRVSLASVDKILDEIDLVRLRRINCTCDDGSLCTEFKPEGLTDECRGCCEGFCRMWDELEKLLGAK